MDTKTTIENNCYISRTQNVKLRRCFMTGEYCSKQNDISTEKEAKIVSSKASQETADNETDLNISAFVIMNFSDMSDVVYRFQIIPFIESLTKYLYYCEEEKRIYCFAESNGSTYAKLTHVNSNNIIENLKSKNEFISQNESSSQKQGLLLKRINRINVTRADSDPTSNYVVCSRICQQLQIADLVIVDVSYQNVNVFYEFGMAVAQEKLILPICYSETFYELSPLYKDHQKIINGTDDNISNIYKDIDHHIDYFPWRRELYEHFGLKRRQKHSRAEYKKFDDVKKDIFNFSDSKYNHFPYADNFPFPIENPCDDLKLSANTTENSASNKQTDNTVGKVLYTALKNGYNQDFHTNTLIIYTIDRVLNEAEAGTCIVNFFHQMTKPLHHGRGMCFLGDRIAVLGKEDSVGEEQKDATLPSDSPYQTGEIILTGVNRAASIAAGLEIKVNTVLNDDYSKNKYYKYLSTMSDNATNTTLVDENETTLKKGLDNFADKVKDYIVKYTGNRAFLVYPQNPLYVHRLSNVQSDLASRLLQFANNTDENKEKCGSQLFFCLYHVMLYNLKNVNQVIVDITDNSIQNLFWLGVAQSLGIYSVTVLHERTDQEIQKLIAKQTYKKHRNIFDVSGLWAATFEKYDTDGFFKRLEDVQQTINYNSKRSIKYTDYYQLYDEYRYSYPHNEKHNQRKLFQSLYKDKKNEEKKQLESYYRKRFWNPLLRFNELNLFVQEKKNESDKDVTINEKYHYHHPSGRISKMDFDTISELNNYLFKRTAIGDFRTITLSDEDGEKIPINESNGIFIGAKINIDSPIDHKAKDISEYIFSQIGKPDFNAGENIRYTRINWKDNLGKNLHADRNKDGNLPGIISLDKGFETPNNNNTIEIKEPHDLIRRKDTVSDESIKSEESIESDESIKSYNEIGQLILWRETVNPSSDVQGKDIERDKSTFFRVVLNGSSGCATLGLSTLFIAEKQKKRYYEKTHDFDTNFLSELQEVVRQKVFIKIHNECTVKLENYINTYIEEELSKPLKEHKDVFKKDFATHNARILMIAYNYLTSILYQYFIPFTIERDILHICNSVRYFLLSLYASEYKELISDDSLLLSNSNSYLEIFKNDEATLKKYDEALNNYDFTLIDSIIPEAIKSILMSITGIEVFYKVTVDYKNGTVVYDTRKPSKIALIEIPKETTTSDSKQSKKKEYYIYLLTQKNEENSSTH